MSFNRKTWIDRESEYPNRRTMTNVNDSSDVKTVDITRAEGTVSVEGSPLNAAALNDLEGRITAMNTSLLGSPVVYTLEAEDWDSETHLITVPVTGVTAASNQEILPMLAVTAANIQNNLALQQANISDAGQATGQITLYAENVPSVDLQVRIIVRT